MKVHEIRRARKEIREGMPFIVLGQLSWYL